MKGARPVRTGGRPEKDLNHSHLAGGLPVFAVPSIEDLGPGSHCVSCPGTVTIQSTYRLHANAYISKPVSLDLFTEAIRQVDDFFRILVKLPN